MIMQLWTSLSRESTYVNNEIRMKDPGAESDQENEEPAKLGVPATRAIDERDTSEWRRVGERSHDVHVALLT